MLREKETIDHIVKTVGDYEIAVRDGNKTIGAGFTLNELIEYIQVTGQCSSRHLTQAERLELMDD